MTMRCLVLSAFLLSSALPVASFAADAGGGDAGGAGAASSKSSVTFGLGLSVAFGAGKPQTAFGVRVFSGNRQNSAVASVGLDYQFATKKLRPNVGLAYLGSNSYIGADVGFVQGQAPNFGMGLGFANTQSQSAAVAPAVDPEDLD